MYLTAATGVEQANANPFSRWARSCASWLEAHPRSVVAVFSAAYFAFTAYQANLKPLWNDEFFTFYIAQAGFQRGWQILLTGADQHPPTFYWLTRVFLWVFGSDPVVVRLPELIGFWLMLLCLFVVTARKTTNLIGYFIMLFPLSTPLYYYAFEARGYALLLGSAAAAYLFWEDASAGRYRKISVPLFAFFITASVCSHYYGILIMIPFAMAEIVRFYTRRKPDQPLWAAFAAPIVPLFAFLPVIQAARAYSTDFWGQPSLRGIDDAFSLVCGAPTVFFISIATIVLLYYIVVRPEITMPRRLSSRERDLALPQLTATIGFVALPVFGYLLASFVTHAYAPRYMIQCAIGVEIVAATLLSIVCKNYRVLQLAIIVLMSGMVAFNQKVVNNSDNNKNILITGSTKILRRYVEAGLPVLAQQNVEALFYLPEDIKNRIFSALDPEASQRYLGHGTVERSASAMKPFFEDNRIWGRNALPYQQFVSQNPEFYVFASTSTQWDWLISKLIDDCFNLQVVQREGELLVLKATKKNGLQ